MRRWKPSAILLAAAMVVGTAPAFAAAPTSITAPMQIAAVNPRCNHDVAGSLERQVRSFNRHGPAANLDALTQRLRALDSILQQAQLERDILQNICTATERPPVEEQLAGVIGWAYALEADAASKRFALLDCPAGVTTVPPALLASAWYALASTLNVVGSSVAAPTPSPAPLVAEVMPKVRRRAAAAGLDLPPVAQTSEYWRDTLIGRAAACASPSPSSTPGPP